MCVAKPSGLSCFWYVEWRGALPKGSCVCNLQRAFWKETVRPRDSLHKIKVNVLPLLDLGWGWLAGKSSRATPGAQGQREFGSGELTLGAVPELEPCGPAARPHGWAQGRWLNVNGRVSRWEGGSSWLWSKASITQVCSGSGLDCCVGCHSCRHSASGTGMDGASRGDEASPDGTFCLGSLYL